MDKSNINQHIGNKFQEYRLKNNLTQNQVSELTGLEPRHISQIERGLYIQSESIVVRWSDFRFGPPNHKIHFAIIAGYQ